MNLHEHSPRPLRGRILLAEELPDLQYVLAQLLECRGLEVVVAADGREAVDALTRESFDMVLVDLRLPTLGGVEAVQTIRDMAQTMPVIGITSDPANSAAGAFLRGGGTGLLDKPVTRRSLDIVLDRHLLTRHDEAAATSPDPGHGVTPALAEARIRYRGTLGDGLDGIGQAMARGDLEAVSFLAHSLSGSAGAFGYRDVRQAAHRLERLADAQDTQGLAGALRELAAASEVVLEGA